MKQRVPVCTDSAFIQGASFPITQGTIPERRNFSRTRTSVSAAWLISAPQSLTSSAASINRARREHHNRSRLDNIRRTLNSRSLTPRIDVVRRRPTGINTAMPMLTVGGLRQLKLEGIPVRADNQMHLKSSLGKAGGDRKAV